MSNSVSGLLQSAGSMLQNFNSARQNQIQQPAGQQSPLIDEVAAR